MLSSSKSGKCPHCLRQIEHSSQFFKILAHTNAAPTKKNVEQIFKDYPFEAGPNYEPDGGTHTSQFPSAVEAEQRSFPEGHLQPEFLTDL